MKQMGKRTITSAEIVRRIKKLKQYVDLVSDCDSDTEEEPVKRYSIRAKQRQPSLLL